MGVDSFKLKACFGGKERKLPFSMEALGWALESLLPVEDYFVVLEANEPVEHCIYVQTVMLINNSCEYMVETRFDYGKSFRHYRSYVPGLNKLKEIFHSFVYGRVPDVGNWEDVTRDHLEDEPQR